MRIVVFVFGIIIFGIGLLMTQMYPHYAGIRMFWSGITVVAVGLITSAFTLITDPDWYL